MGLEDGGDRVADGGHERVGIAAPCLGARRPHRTRIARAEAADRAARGRRARPAAAGARAAGRAGRPRRTRRRARDAGAAAARAASRPPVPSGAGRARPPAGRLPPARSTRRRMSAQLVLVAAGPGRVAWTPSRAGPPPAWPSAPPSRAGGRRDPGWPRRRCRRVSRSRSAGRPVCGRGADAAADRLHPAARPRAAGKRARGEDEDRAVSLQAIRVAGRVGGRKTPGRPVRATAASSADRRSSRSLRGGAAVLVCARRGRPVAASRKADGESASRRRHRGHRYFCCEAWSTWPMSSVVRAACSPVLPSRYERPALTRARS